MKPASPATATARWPPCAQRRPQLVVLDIWLQGAKLDGIQVLDTLKREQPDLPVVMISGHGTIETAVSSIKKGAYDFMEKPFKADRLLHVVERALEAARLQARGAGTEAARPATTPNWSASPPAIAQLRQPIEKIAPTNSRVLISGRPARARKWLARLIHARSRRAANAFVAINCRGDGRPTGWRAELFGEEGRRRPAQDRAVRAGAQRHALSGRSRATCRWRPRARSCACWSTRASAAWAAPRACRWMRG